MWVIFNGRHWGIMSIEDPQKICFFLRSHWARHRHFPEVYHPLTRSRHLAMAHGPAKMSRANVNFEAQRCSCYDAFNPLTHHRVPFSELAQLLWWVPPALRGRWQCGHNNHPYLGLKHWHVNPLIVIVNLLWCPVLGRWRAKKNATLNLFHLTSIFCVLRWSPFIRRSFPKFH